MTKYILLIAVITLIFPPLGIVLAAIVMGMKLTGVLNGTGRNSGSWAQRREADAWARQPAKWTPEDDLS